MYIGDLATVFITQMQTNPISACMHRFCVSIHVFSGHSLINILSGDQKVLLWFCVNNTGGHIGSVHFMVYCGEGKCKRLCIYI